MKIKQWLMVSFFIVMLLPVVALYILYVSLSNLDEKQAFVEYVEMTHKMEEIETHLLNPDLYQLQPKEKFESVQALTNESIKITLYRSDGVVVFSSLPSVGSYGFSTINIEQVYRNLNDLQKNSRTYTLKKPVVGDGDVVGVFEISIAREDWIEGVTNRYILFGVSFSIFIILLYIIVVILLNRKLNRPLSYLQAQMTAFANGEKLSNQTRESNNEIGDLIKHFWKMKSQIEQTQEALAVQQKEKEFIVASLSHDLKTPLTVIRAYTEALQNDETLAEQERLEYKEILFEKLEYMKRMLDDLTMYTALQSSKQRAALVEVDGEEYFDMLLSGYDEPCNQRDISLVVTQSVKETYELDPKQLVRVVDNIMGNAIRHTKKGNQIWLAAISSDVKLPDWVFKEFYDDVEVWRKNGTVILIQNEGKGIPKEQLEKVFQPFYQAEGARNNGGSSGLGLSISKMLMEQQNGKIGIWSTEKEGTLLACWIKEGRK
ncbi:HAMP domain-containing sensor histidine kinase [Fredinandcohnia sp. QZ13]|uniref:sensor histidine kinase n=1 Tax=Fredinandcohnia sp. QZ13 TaxID=3073144 RepID=UPI0028536315|nr:HAMP domain-containing sensor histidine kinase [Fredinandcohnia sp. QZ13]MDR4887085.1 HAMP domain-containing sensor histidine kinase [Fredinandcohnia sp. QZ13]